MSGLYASARGAFADGLLDWVADDIRAILVAGYSPNLDTETSFTTASPFTTIGGSMVENRTASATGAAFADDLGFGGVNGPTSSGILIYRHSEGSRPRSLLIAFITAVVTPNGGDVLVDWPTTGIFIL
jgi:hypothetical protein